MAAKPKPNPEHILDRTTITVSLKVKKEWPNVKTAAFVFKHDDVEVQRLEVPVEKHFWSKNEFKGQYEAPPPAADAHNYLLTCELDLGEGHDPIPYGQAWVVWHGLIKLNVKCKDPGSGEFNDFGFASEVAYRQHGESHDLLVDANGWASFEPAPGEFDFALASPLRLIEWEAGKDVGPERVMKVEVTPCRAVIRSPGGADGEAVKTYVNTSEDAADVKLELASLELHGEAPVPGQKLHVKVTFDNPTRRGRYAGEAPFNHRNSLADDKAAGEAELAEVTEQVEQLTAQKESLKAEMQALWHQIQAAEGDAREALEAEKRGKSMEYAQLQPQLMEAENAQKALQSGVSLTTRVDRAEYLAERTVEGLDDAPDPAAMPNAGRDFLAADTVEWTGTVTTDDGGRASFFVHLGKGGGETCTIAVGSTDACDQSTLTLESWRRIFAQVCHGNTAKTTAAFPPDKRAATIAAYEEVFIDLHFLDDIIYPPDLDLDGHGGWTTQEAIGGSGDGAAFAINIGGNGWRRIGESVAPPASRSFGGAPVPDGLYVNIATCDLMFDTHNVLKTVGRDKLGDAKLTLNGTDVSHARDADQELKYTFGSLGSAEIKKNRAFYYEGPSPEGGRTDIPDSALKLSSKPKDDGGKLTIELPQELRDRVAAGADMHVAIDCMMVVKDGGAEAVSNGSDAIALGHGANGNAETNNTVIHEIGHAIGMCGDAGQLVGSAAATWNRLPDYEVGKRANDPRNRDYIVTHTRSYQGRGHVGNHCATGLGQKSFDAWGKLDTLSPKNLGSYKCVIYGQAQLLTSPVRYCPECVEMLKAMELRIGPREQVFGADP